MHEIQTAQVQKFSVLHQSALSLHKARNRHSSDSKNSSVFIHITDFWETTPKFCHRKAQTTIPSLIWPCDIGLFEQLALPTKHTLSSLPWRQVRHPQPSIRPQGFQGGPFPASQLEASGTKYQSLVSRAYWPLHASGPDATSTQKTWYCLSSWCLFISVEWHYTIAPLCLSLEFQTIWATGHSKWFLSSNRFYLPPPIPPSYVGEKQESRSKSYFQLVLKFQQTSSPLGKH